MIRHAFVVLTLLSSSAALADEARVAAGDGVNGARLFRLHCASCHGADANGAGFLAEQLKAPSPTNLKNPAFLVQRSDDDLYKATMKGGPAVGGHWSMPAFEAALGVLEGWDLVAFIREGAFSVSDFFPDAARFTSKTYLLDADAQSRVSELLGNLSEDEREITVASVFGGDKAAGAAPIFVPQEPRELDTLKRKNKMGYLAFVDVPVPGVQGTVSVAIAMAKDGVIEKLVPRLPASVKEKDRPKVEKLFAGYVGQGGKKSPERQKYVELKPAKGAPKEAAAVAKSLTRAYYRALEGAIMFDKEEAERHWAD